MMLVDQFSIQNHGTPTIGELQSTLERVAKSISEFDLVSKKWSSFHQNGGNGSIIGYAWQDYQTHTFDNIVSIRGLRGLKQLINKELIWLERLTNDAKSTNVPCPGSNTIYICTLWQRTMNAARNKQDPIISLDSQFPLPSKKKPAKVDIVCESGQRWIRISTLKPIGLLSEFRSGESYIVCDDDENDDDVDEDENMKGSIEQMNQNLAKDELDLVAKQSSIIKIVDDLDLAASHFAKSSFYGRPSIELLLNRLTLHDLSEIEGKFYDDQEKFRFEARLRAIVKYSKLKGVEIILADSEQFIKLSSFQSNPIPDPPQIQSSLAATKTLHLDLSALIAFVSHISHMHLPKNAEEAELQFSKIHWRQDLNEGSIDGEDEEHQIENQNELEQQSNNEEGRGQHSRALSEQLRREMTEDCFFDVLIRHLDEENGFLHLTCTREAHDKMLDIISLVGGEMEQKRTKCLFDTDGEAKDLWKDSRWSKQGLREQRVREKIILPVKVIDAQIDANSQTLTQFDQHFVQLAKRSLSSGLHTLSTRSKSSHNAFAALRQTRHTITSMLTGVEQNQTTLTTNISSVKWLVKDMSRLQSYEGSMPGYHLTTEQKDVKAALWVMYPRSLSERMALSNVDQDQIQTYSSSGGSGSDVITPSEDDYSKLGGIKTKNTAQFPSALAILNNLSAGPSSFEPRGRSNRMRRFIKRFLLGPNPKAQLEIKHYRWWPFARIENAWYKITLPIAWKDPNGNDNHHKSKNSGNDVERGSTMNEKRTPIDGDYDPWWHSVMADVRLNGLHWCLLCLTLIGWVLGFSFLSKSLWYEGGVVNQDGVLTDDTSFYGCTSTFWLANSGCGYNGEGCSPFSSTSPYDFRCPANCQTTVLGQQRAVGDQLPAFVPLVVGGSNMSSSMSSIEGDKSPYIYRADSFICSAAIHAGLFSESRGGCGRLWLTGAYSGYESVERYGINSTSFNSTFPISFYFDDNVSGKNCQDNRYRGYILNTILLAFVGFILRPKQIVYFFTLICVGFFHINFISEPRQYPMSVGSVFGDFLPTLFVGYALWRLNYRFTFPILFKIPIEANIWIQGFYWLGTLLDVVFVNVPLNQLVAQDISETPGALTSLIIIVIVVLCLAINQIRVIRKVGLLPKYLTLAIIGGILVGLLALVPTTSLHIHHYIIALVFIPFCAFETRLSLMYSAFLLGMFLNGVGRWSYDGIIQDTAVVIGANLVGGAIPTFLAASNFTGVSPFNTTIQISINSTSNLTELSSSMTGLVNWHPIPANLTKEWDSFQLLVDDVLRLQANQTYYDLGQLASNYIAFNQSTSSATAALEIALINEAANYTIYPGGQEPSNILEILVEQPHYLRLAYYNSITSTLGDFTEAGTIFFNGTFISPGNGAT